MKSTIPYAWMDQPDTWRTFAFCSINLSHLLPDMPLSRHAAHFAEMKRLKRLNTLENSHRQLERLTRGDTWPTGIEAPAIVATFHTGPYHLVCGRLMQQRIPFSLVLSADVIRKQGGNYRRLYRDLTGEPATADTFDVIDASDAHSLLRMRTALRKGHLLVLYVDGNMGASGRRGQPSGLELAFLGGTLRVKTGAAHLSHLMRCPVYPVLCRWQGNRAAWQPAQPIMPRTAEIREAYTARCMAGVYRLLAEMLQHHAPQWEGWGYVHHDLAVNAGSMDFRQLDAAALVERFMPVVFGGKAYLLQRDTLFAHSVSDAFGAAVWDDAKKFFGI